MVHPRVHDLRHGFAVDTLIRWQESGVDIDDRIAVLSAYLGHVDGGLTPPRHEVSPLDLPQR